MKLVGFDIFETLLVRQVSPPEAVFFELGKELRGENAHFPEPSVFCEERRSAERRCYASKGTKTTIFDIYLELLDSLGLDPNDHERLARREFELEDRLLRPIETNIDILKDHRTKGDRIVFVSDMYYPVSFLNELLAGRGISNADEDVYVSCDYGVDKKKGGLFKRVIEDTGIPASDFYFYGNNLRADVLGAKRAGVQPTHLTLGNPTRYENVLGDAGNFSNGLGARLAGASRRSRIAHSQKAEEKSVVSVGAGVAAPLLICYVLWILERSRALGVKRLYFLARDGEVMLGIAEILVKRLELDIECRYLFASRCAWARATRLESLGEWYFGDLNETTTSIDVLDRLGVSWDEAKSVFETNGFPESKARQPLQFNDLKPLGSLIESEQFTPVRDVAIGRHRAQLKRYFQQEGVFDHKRIGLIDVGWSGTLHEIGADVFTEEVPDGDAFGFLFGAKARESAKLSRFAHTKFGYYFDLDRSTGERVPLVSKEFFILMEVFCCASHGTLLGLREENGKIVPDLEKSWAAVVESWGLSTFRSAVLSVAENLNISEEDLSRAKAMRPHLRKLVDLFWETPTREEALQWGRFPWNNGQGSDSGLSCLAQRRTLTGKLFAIGMKKIRKTAWSRPWEWRHGTQMISSVPYRLAWLAPAYARQIKASIRSLRKIW